MRRAKTRDLSNTTRGMITTATSMVIALAMLTSHATSAIAAHGGHGDAHRGAIMNLDAQSGAFVAGPAGTSRRHIVSRHVAAFHDGRHHPGAASFWTLGADGAWIETFVVSPQAPDDTHRATEHERAAVATGPRVIQPPQVAQGRSIQVVRGNHVGYALF